MFTWNKNTSWRGIAELLQKCIAFWKFKSHLGIMGGKKAMERSHTLNNTTTFSIYGLYETCFYLLISIQWVIFTAPMPCPESKQNADTHCPIWFKLGSNMEGQRWPSMPSSHSHTRQIVIKPKTGVSKQGSDGITDDVINSGTRKAWRSLASH